MAQYAALGIGVEAWVELTQAEDRANKRSFHDLSGVTVNWRTFKLVMKVLRAIRIEDFKELETLRTQLVQSESRLTSLTQAQHRLIAEWREKSDARLESSVLFANHSIPESSAYDRGVSVGRRLCADDLARLGQAEQATGGAATSGKS